MFEAAELGRTLDKDTYKEMVPALRTGLLNLQQGLRECDFPVILLISGADGAGKSETVNLLHQWMDPRWIETTAFDEPSDEERERPAFWRFWRALPPKGRIGVLFGSWYSHPIAERVADRVDDDGLDVMLKRINTFEKMLVDGGALLIKLWFHLGKEMQVERIRKLRKNPKTRWRVGERDLAALKSYDRFRAVAEQTLRLTSTGEAPWMIIEGFDERHRNVTTASHILEVVRRRMELDPKTLRGTTTAWKTPREDEKTILDFLDLDLSLDKKSYRKQLADYQGRLNVLARKARERKVSTIVVLEGWDAAGKGGIIRRITRAIDARSYRVIPVAAPTDEERAHHYLWRFWRHIPRAGRFTIYDRSWYGRVLVERVEGYAADDEWIRAYREINEFEEELTDHGIVLLKFWVHIDKDEQLLRFRAREETSFKQHKITEEDYRNREKWDDYAHAVNDMVERTSTEFAPWNLIEGNDKRWARVCALQVLCERLEQAL
ncbi:UDP-galactose-lipid carrier transferase [Thioalkalivibrio nitratireducens DSM 14787]|uniref:UDP-galactose-lipid carrier transferase n=1 Tax=Thioalkalivibrio nitratireducens (strain DSM 14787 / UNIQEM 213 / ALEN2) TaxID=1255043 RepID=L0DS15_THIND|nr:polyphosphate:AMP phosphotransferase [Thioalkalivibrio nitratireducens]AGA31803.1 UDP-galactose-lipid carrier transferase [Thioalkalivibrio nitratireducens DSM 14787]